MRWLVDAAYAIAALVSSPVWLYRMIRTGKIRTDWRGRFGRCPSPAPSARPRLVIHAVSVGEVNAIRGLVDRLSRDLDVVIATTTDTGFARASALFADQYTVVRYPFDFSFAVNRFLDILQPDVVALVELEVWPNFTAECARRGVPVVVVNGRLSKRSFARYRLVRPILSRMFGRLSAAAVQTEDYAVRFAALGVPSNRVVVTGTMKWDSALLESNPAAAEQLAEAMGIDRERPLVVAGSTAPGEHELLERAVPEGVQLLCAPRRPEWFDQAASVLPKCARRSRGDRGSETGRFLLDTIGELQNAYALADVVVVGRSFGDLHGSDMMEPVGLGKPTIVGPAVSDFQDTVDVLLAADALMQVSAEALSGAIRTLLENDNDARTQTSNARRCIVGRQGATERHAQLVMKIVGVDSGAPDLTKLAVPALDRDGEGGERRKEEKMEKGAYGGQ